VTEPSFAAGLVGVVLDGRYRLDALVGEGGMGAVYRAQHLAMDRKVAVKLLKPHLAGDEVALQRFAREASSTLKVESPHAVKILDFGVTPMRDYYMVLEYLDGRTVQRELDVDGTFAPARVIHIGRHALAALGAAHRIGIVHRDIKPDNILLMKVGDDPDFGKVLDFGVAKLMEGSARSAKSLLSLTQAGMVFGTPEFMSPEQACGQPLDGRSDLYSLAATMFAMLTGRALYEGKTPIEWLTHHARTPAPHLADLAPGLAEHTELDAVLQRCFAKHKEQRPASAEELDAMLAALEGHQPAVPEVRQPAMPKVTMFSPSTYMPALVAEPETVPEGVTIRPPTVEPVAASRRGPLLLIGAVAVVAMIVVTVVVATRSRTSRSTSVSDAAVALPHARDAAVDVAIVIDAPAPIDAGVPDARVAAVPVPVPHGSPADQHLRAAEGYKRAGNHLLYLFEAEAAVKADPRSVQAHYLLGDALLDGGDLEHGCKALQALGRNPAAMARAHAAGCPN
jgi:eukaryotic-like serine/threonine-protein kinase